MSLHNENILSVDTDNQMIIVSLEYISASLKPNNHNQSGLMCSEYSIKIGMAYDAVMMITVPLWWEFMGRPSIYLTNEP